MTDVIIPSFPTVVKVGVPGISPAPGESGITVAAADVRYIKRSEIDLTGATENEVLTSVGGIAVWREPSIPLASTNW